jgi:hypothetical protein
MAKLDGGQFLDDLNQKDSRLAQLFQRIITGVNNVAGAAGVAPFGETAPPTSPNGISVSVPAVGSGSEMIHVAIADNNPLNRNARYFSEISTTPSFSQPIVVDHGASRTSHPIPLPTMSADGTTTHTYYVRSYSQYPGSKPSAPVVYGGASPIGIQMAGSSKLDLQPSTGSGTAPGSGQSAGQGLGKFQTRLLKKAGS